MIESFFIWLLGPNLAPVVEVLAIFVLSLCVSAWIVGFFDGGDR